jgi:hypothetical protein
MEMNVRSRTLSTWKKEREEKDGHDETMRKYMNGTNISKQKSKEKLES